MVYKVGDIIVSGTSRTPIVSQIVEVLENHYRIYRPVHSLLGEEPWQRFDGFDETMLERKNDVKRKANPDEIDAWLDFYNTTAI